MTFFYLILSQVFCLYTLQDKLIGRLLKDVPSKSWSSLGELLCRNEDLSPSVVEYFATFPAPVGTIIDSQWCQFFLEQTDVIGHFLREPPCRWIRIVNISNQRGAPPLIQEMVQELNLTSPVIQTTVFRAIARLLWFRDDPGLEFLMSLHEMDQQTYTQERWRRTPREMFEAYGVLNRIYNDWQQHRRRSPGSEEGFSNPDAYHFFTRKPPSMEPNSNFEVDSSHGQYSWASVQGAANYQYNGGSWAGNNSSIECVAGVGGPGPNAVRRGG